ELLSRAQKGKREQSLYQTETKAAEQALAQEDYEGAEQHAKQALELRPADATARELLSRAQEGKLEESLRQAEIKAAQKALAQEDYEGAEQHAKQALELRPADATARELLSKAQEGKLEESLHQVAIKAASEALAQEDYEGAEQHAKQASELRPADPTARELLARAQEGKRKESLRQAE